MMTAIAPIAIREKGRVAILPWEAYEEYLALKKSKPIPASDFPAVKIAKKHKKFYDKLNLDLEKAVKEYEEGRGYGPFDTVEEMMESLEK